MNHSMMERPESPGSEEAPECEMWWTMVARTVPGGRLLSERLRSGEQHLRLIFEKAAIGIGLANPDGRFIKTNRELQRMLGYSARELKGKSFEDVSHPDDVHRNLRIRSDAVRSGREGYQLDKRYIRKDGSTIWAHIKVTVARDAVGRPDFFIAMVQDTSERVRAVAEAARRAAEVEQALELAKLKDHVLSLISHEMRTPLSIIVANAELLQERCPEPLSELCPGVNLFEGIKQASAQLIARIEQVIDYSALASGSLALYRTEVNVAEILQTAARAVAAEVERRRIVLEIQVAEDLPPLLADSRRLTQMVAELLSNAVRVTPDGARVRIHATRQGEGARIEVRDSGPGISRERRREIWNAFEQGGLEDTDHTSGLGLGLAIVGKLAELHGGKACLESSSSPGSCFSLVLPGCALTTPGTRFSEASFEAFSAP